jgi:hypothetical protein
MIEPGALELLPKWLVKLCGEVRSELTVERKPETVRVQIRVGMWIVRSSVSVDRGLTRSYGKYSVRLEHLDGPWASAWVFGGRFDDVAYGNDARRAERTMRQVCALLGTGVRPPARPPFERGRDAASLLRVLTELGLRPPLALLVALGDGPVGWLRFPDNGAPTREHVLAVARPEMPIPKISDAFVDAYGDEPGDEAVILWTTPFA